MTRHRLLKPLLASLIGAVVLVSSSTVSVSAHARYDRSEPAAGSMVSNEPFVLRAWFTQELMLRSTITVVDAAGTRVDLGDGRVDQDDPNRKVMLVSLPALPDGVYTVQFVAASAEDGHDEPGSFNFGVNVTPSAADSPTTDDVAARSGAPTHVCGE